MQSHNLQSSMDTRPPWTKWPPIWQTTFSNAFSSMKMTKLWFKFHWNMFSGVQLTISQHWFRWWLGAEQATSHYLNQWWPSSLTHICGTRGKWVKQSLRSLSYWWRSYSAQIFVLVMLPHGIFYVSVHFYRNQTTETLLKHFWVIYLLHLCSCVEDIFLDDGYCHCHKSFWTKARPLRWLSARLQ